MLFEQERPDKGHVYHNTQSSTEDAEGEGC